MGDGAESSWVEQRVGELVPAVSLLTRVPVPAPAAPTQQMLADRIWAFPLVGAAIGLVGGGVLAAALWLGLPALFAAGLALAATALVTGALHEDGLADTCDGLGGGHTREAKLEIMRDSRIGSYGALALMLSVLLRAAALTAIPDPWSAVAALVAAHAASRGLLAGLLAVMAPARLGGLSAAGDHPGIAASAVAIALAVAIPVRVWPGAGVIAALLVGLLLLAALGLLAQRQLGGYTGDVLGAGQQLVEIALLAAAAASAAQG